MGWLPMEALNERRFCYKEGSLWQSGKCHHLSFLPRQKSPIGHRDNQQQIWVQGKTVSYFRGKIVAALHIEQVYTEISIFPPVRYVFFLDPCNLDIISRRIKSIALCVSKCPAAELNTHSDLKQFALNNGEKRLWSMLKVQSVRYDHSFSLECTRNISNIVNRMWM